MAATAPQYPKDDNTTEFGDFVSTEDEELDLEEVVEPWQKYHIEETPRVFYPVRVGEVLNDRYLVEHKIGAGGFSTIWMPVTFKTRGINMSMATRMSAAQQLLEALENLHKAGIVHRGE
ncbi:hypothetical protein BO71DRAFT_449045 [Aspergillus ellipticus CBS 707.79]|uniref:Protein kinase domain-containing protein n=1 Tax=Aspergillus ellipticus CBS 707.79 TaxID=1448320 RepID=A0A319DP85_9EURO|nr:hypothetical protein BO71DRAFT_449045 [Aspergillus ellipticus CBS 707.79]